MNILTFLFDDGQRIKYCEEGTIPQIQQKFYLGRTLKINDKQLKIEALTIEKN